MKKRILIILVCLIPALSLWAEVTDTEQSLFDKGQKALEDTLYNVAEVYYLNFLTQFPQSELRSDAQLGLAQALYYEKRHKDAVKLLQTNVKSAPKNLQAEYRFWLAETCSKLGRPDEAAKGFEQLLADSPMDKRADDARYSLAWIYSQQNRFDEATVLLKTVQKNERADLAARAALGLAMIPYFQKNLDEAEKNLNAVVKKFPKTPAAIEAKSQLAQIAFEKGNETVAIQRYQEITESDQPGASEFVEEALLRIGDIYEKQKKYADAVVAYERAFKKTRFETVKMQALEKFVSTAEKNDRADFAADKLKAWSDDPKNPMSDDLSLALVKLLRKAGKGEKASAELDDFFERFPQSELTAEALLEQGGILEQGGTPEQAILVYQKVLNATKVPELQAEAYFKIAAIQRIQGNADEAAKTYQRAAALKGADDLAVQAWWENGQAQMKAQNWAAATATFDKLIKKYPDDPRAREASLQIAAIAFQRGQFDQAIQDYDDFIQKYGNADTLTPRALSGKIQALSRKPDWNALLAASRNFLRDFPSHESAPQVKLYQGFALEGVGKVDEALKEFENLVKDHPNTEAGAMAGMRSAERFFSQKNYAKAQEQFALVGKNFPNSSVASDAAYFVALSAYKFKQDLNEAKKLAAKYLELYPNGTHSFEARMLQGDILTEQQDYAGALVVYENLIGSTDIAKRPDLTPLYLSAMGRKGELLRILEKYDGAISTFQSILDLPNVDLEMVYNTEVQIARCYEKKGDRTKALEHYLNVIYGDKATLQSAESFWYAKAGLNAATLKEEQKDFSGAAKILQRMVKSNSSCKTIATERLKQIRDLHPELP